MLRSLCGNQRLNHVVAVRLLGPAYFQRGESSVPVPLSETKQKLQKLLQKELPKPYDGPERDLINFPRRVRPVEPGKIRMGFLPDEWFQFFYKKTGVTGPYLFGTGLLTFLLSKELYVIEDEFSTGCSIFLLVYIAIKKFGPATRKIADKMIEDEENAYVKDKEGQMQKLVDAMAHEKKVVWHDEGQKILLEAKRENIQMQLETEYRKRLMQVYEQTKRRLDYHLEQYNTRRKFEQKHMVDWIVSSVIKSITPEQEKEALKKCVDDLNALAAKVH